MFPDDEVIPRPRGESRYDGAFYASRVYATSPLIIYSKFVANFSLTNTTKPSGCLNVATRVSFLFNNGTRASVVSRFLPSSREK